MTYFLRARRISLGACVLTALAALSVMLGTLQLPSLRPAFGDIYVPVLASALIAVVSGIVSATLLDSPLPSLERSAARNLLQVRATTLLSLTSFGVMLVEFGAFIHPAQGALVREPAHFLAGMGLMLLCLLRFTPPTGWCIVLSYSLGCLLAGGALTNLSSFLLFDATGTWPRLVSALVTWCLGAIGYVRAAPRPDSAEEPLWWQ